MNVFTEWVPSLDVGARQLEIVERKGIGHPDTLADAVAEAASRAYSNYCLQAFGVILHYNADKTGLLGGASTVRFGGGSLTKPITVQINGRFSPAFAGKEIPVRELITEAARSHIETVLRLPNPSTDLEFVLRTSTTSSPGYVADHTQQSSSPRARWFNPTTTADLPETSHLRSNDTSCGVGFSPLSTLEKYVLKVERHLNGAQFKASNPWIGSDIKIMGTRYGRNIHLTAAVPQIDSHVHSVRAYQDNLRRVRDEILGQRPTDDVDIRIDINTRDDFDIPELYLTVTGSAIESGDEGLVGRGNRPNGLITPMRVASIEGASGKNPVYHIGKLYNILASSVADDLHRVTGDHIAVLMVSQSGRSLCDPSFVSVLHSLPDSVSPIVLSNAVDRAFQQLPEHRAKLLSGDLVTY